jgi:hypothetical protein
MTPTARRLALYGALAIALVLWTAAKVNAYLVGRDAREAAANQLVVLEALGARRATVAAKNAEKRLAEMQAVVPGLERELAAAKAAGAPAAIVFAAEGEGTAERIPCEEVVQIYDSTGAPAGTQAVASVAPGARFEAAIFPTADGTIAWKSKLWGWTVYGEGKRTARQEIPTTSSDLVVDPVLGKALTYYQDRPSRFALLPRAPRHWRVGWSCGPGGGVSFAGEGWAGAACVYGPQF